MKQKSSIKSKLYKLVPFYKQVCLSGLTLDGTENKLEV